MSFHSPFPGFLAPSYSTSVTFPLFGFFDFLFPVFLFLPILFPFWIFLWFLLSLLFPFSIPFFFSVSRLRLSLFVFRSPFPFLSIFVPFFSFQFKYFPFPFHFALPFALCFHLRFLKNQQQAATTGYNFGKELQFWPGPWYGSNDYICGRCPSSPQIQREVRGNQKVMHMSRFCQLSAFSRMWCIEIKSLFFSSDVWFTNPSQGK